MRIILAALGNTMLLLAFLLLDGIASGQRISLQKIDPGSAVDLQNDTIEKYISNQETNQNYYFRDHCYFNGAFFSDSLDFTEVSFSKFCYFIDAHFAGNADFSDAIFSETARFDTTQFNTNSYFENTIFYDGAFFKAARFGDAVRFTDATFSKDVIFTGVHFANNAYFDDVSFLKGAYFNGAQFSAFAKFTNLTLTDSTEMDFTDAVLPDTLDFSENKALKSEIDLTNADFTNPRMYNNESGAYKPHLIFLYKTDISRFRIDYFHFCLLLPDSTLSPTCQGRRQKISNDEKESIYEALLNNFKLQGQDESYKRLDIEYQNFKWKHSWAWWLRWLPALWWNFGYDKEYIFVWVIGLVFFFSVINIFALDFMNGSVYPVDNIPADTSEMRVGKRVWYSLLYTSNIFFRLSLDAKGIRLERLLATIYLFVIYLMGIVCLGYMANFVLQK
jgi:hypothetical protein